MKPKLLGVVAACVLVLTVGAANADTFFPTGTFGAGTDHSHCGGLFGGPCNYNWSGGTLLGTVDITNGNVTAVNLTVNIDPPYFLINPSYSFTTLGNSLCIGCAIASLSQSGTILSLSLQHVTSTPEIAFLSIIFNLATGTFTSSYEYGFDTGGNGFDFTDATWSGSGTFTATPLPAALPLFASGLGALGLLGGRRKRKAQAVA